MTEDNEPHVVASLYKRIGDEHTREVGEWLHEVIENHSQRIEVEEGTEAVIIPSLPWVAEAVSHYIASMILENEVLGTEFGAPEPPMLVSELMGSIFGDPPVDQWFNFTGRIQKGSDGNYLFDGVKVILEGGTDGKTD